MNGSKAAFVAVSVAYNLTFATEDARRLVIEVTSTPTLMWSWVRAWETCADFTSVQYAPRVVPPTDWTTLSYKAHSVWIDTGLYGRAAACTQRQTFTRPPVEDMRMYQLKRLFRHNDSRPPCNQSRSFFDVGAYLNI